MLASTVDMLARTLSSPIGCCLVNLCRRMKYC